MLHLEIFISMGNFESNLIFTILVSFQSVPVVDQTGARRVVVVRELLTIRDRGGGELVTLHLLLIETQLSRHARSGNQLKI